MTIKELMAESRKRLEALGLTQPEMSVVSIAWETAAFTIQQCIGDDRRLFLAILYHAMACAEAVNENAENK